MCGLRLTASAPTLAPRPPLQLHAEVGAAVTSDSWGYVEGQYDDRTAGGRAPGATITSALSKAHVGAFGSRAKALKHLFRGCGARQHGLLYSLQAAVLSHRVCMRGAFRTCLRPKGSPFHCATSNFAGYDRFLS